MCFPALGYNRHTDTVDRTAAHIHIATHSVGAWAGTTLTRRLLPSHHWAHSKWQRAASLWLHSQAAAERFWKERGAAAGFGDGVEVRKKRRMPLAAIPQCTTVARIERVGVERILVAVGVIKELARLAMRSRDGGSVGDSVFDGSDHGLGALHARGPQTVRVPTWQPAAARSARDAGRLAAEAAGSSLRLATRMSSWHSDCERKPSKRHTRGCQLSHSEVKIRRRPWWMVIRYTLKQFQVRLCT